MRLFSSTLGRSWNPNVTGRSDMHTPSFRVIPTMLRTNFVVSWDDCRIIGWGGATLSRYENGALQDITHDRFIQLLKKPENLQSLILNNGGFLPDEKKERILEELSAEIGESCTIPKYVEQHIAKYGPEMNSGFNRLNIDKLFEAIKFFATDGVFKTKLCKLLFYADFKHFKDYAVSITGAKYVSGLVGVDASTVTTQ